MKFPEKYASLGQSVLLNIDLFDQPSWIEAEQDTPLSLDHVTGLAFGSTKSLADFNFSLDEVVLYNFKGVPESNLKNSATLSKSVVQIQSNQLSLHLTEPSMLRVSSVQGRTIVVKSFKAGNYTLPLNSSLATGLYLYQIESVSGVVQSGNMIIR